MKLIKTFGAIALCAGFAAPAFSDVYVGGGIYNTNVDEGSFDDDDTVPAFFVGYKPMDFLALEAGYYDLGDYSKNGDSVEADAYTLGVNLIAPLWILDVYAKGGVAQVNWEYDIAGLSDDGDDTEAYYGVGANLNITPLLDIYLEYLVVDADVEVDAFGAGIRLEF